MIGIDVVVDELLRQAGQIVRDVGFYPSAMIAEADLVGRQLPLSPAILQEAPEDQLSLPDTKNRICAAAMKD